MSTLVLYHSKYGTTKKYAEALARELSCPAINQETARDQDLTLADTLVFGSSIRASGLGFSRFVKNHAAALAESGWAACRDNGWCRIAG